MKRINTREDLRELAGVLGVRPDWHEPDEQKLTASVFGHSFDNAGFWPLERYNQVEVLEQHVVLIQDGVAVAAVNLATLFSWACD